MHGSQRKRTINKSPPMPLRLKKNETKERNREREKYGPQRMDNEYRPTYGLRIEAPPRPRPPPPPSPSSSLLFGANRVGQVLLVGENQEDGIAQFVLHQHAVQLVPRLPDTIAIVAVHDEDEALGVLKVVAPEGADFVLTAHVPHGEGDVLVFDRLNIEADGRNGGDNLAKLELVEDGGFTGGIQSNHKNAHLLFGDEASKELRERDTHDEQKMKICQMAQTFEVVSAAAFPNAPPH